MGGYVGYIHKAQELRHKHLITEVEYAKIMNRIKRKTR